MAGSTIGLNYADHMAVVFASTGKNNATAIAIATMAFTPLVAIPAATMPIFQILLLVLYLKMAPMVKQYFATGHLPGMRGHWWRPGPHLRHT